MSESFDLKLDRADHHLKELKREIRRFTDKHAYEAVPVASTNRKTRGRKYKLRFFGQPNEMLPMIVGDVVHNVRSALDHLIVAYLRRDSASFPIFKDCPFGRDGELLDNKLGEAWNKAVGGLRDPLITQVKLLQPYQRPGQEVLDFCVANGLEPSDIQALPFRVLSLLW